MLASVQHKLGIFKYYKGTATFLHFSENWRFKYFSTVLSCSIRAQALGKKWKTVVVEQLLEVSLQLSFFLW